MDVPSPAWQALNDRDLASTRETLDRRAFESAWAQGMAMTLEEAVAHALSEADAPESPGP